MTQALPVIPLVVTIVDNHDRIVYLLENSLGSSPWNLMCILPRGWSNLHGRMNRGGGALPPSPIFCQPPKMKEFNNKDNYISA